MQADIRELYASYKTESITPREFARGLLAVVKKACSPDDIIDELEILATMPTLSIKSMDSFLVRLIEWGDKSLVAGKRLELILRDDEKDQMKLF